MKCRTASHTNREKPNMSCIHWRCIKCYKLNCPAVFKTEKQSSKRNLAIITTANPVNVSRRAKWIKLKEESSIEHQVWQLPEKHSKIMHFHLQCPKNETVSQKRQEKMFSIHSKSQWRNDYENTLIHIELQNFEPTCVYVLLLNKTEKPIKERLKWWRKKRTPTLF